MSEKIIFVLQGHRNALISEQYSCRLCRSKRILSRVALKSSSPSSTKLSKLKSLSSQTSLSALATNLIIEVNIFGEHDVCVSDLLFIAQEREEKKRVKWLFKYKTVFIVEIENKTTTSIDVKENIPCVYTGWKLT